MIRTKNILSIAVAGAFTAVAAQPVMAQVSYNVTALTNNTYAESGLAGNKNGVIVWSGTDAGGDYEIFTNDGVTTTKLTNNTRQDGTPRINSRGDIAWVRTFSEVRNGVTVPVAQIIKLADGVEQVMGEVAGTSTGVTALEMNDAGQVVWIARQSSTLSNVYFHDGVSAQKITADDTITESLPQINAVGTLAWVAGPNVFLYKDGVVSQFTNSASNNFPRLNDKNEIVWVRGTASGRTQIVYFNGVTEQVVSDATENAFLPLLNNAGDIVWHSIVSGKYEVIRYSQGVRSRLSTAGENAVASTLTDNGVITWVSTPTQVGTSTIPHMIHIWDNGVVSTIDPPKHMASNVSISDAGQVAFFGVNYNISYNSDGKYTGSSINIYSSEIYRASADTNHAPVANAGADQVVECSGELTAVMLDGSLSMDQDNDVLSYNWLGSFGSVTGMKPTLNLGLGTYPITMSVSDTKNESDSDSVTINVVDTKAPSLSIGSNRSFEATSRDGASYALPIQASDTCGSVTLSKTGVKDVYPMGTSNVSVTASDTTGNSITESINIQVVDTTPPMLTPPDDVTVVATADLTPVTIVTATATDLFDVTVTNDAPNVFPIGTRAVTWTATDSNNNSASAQQNVTVQYGFGGFRSPLQQGGIYKLGRVLPVKVAVTYANGAPVTNAIVTLSLFQTVAGEVTGAALDVSSSSAADVGTTLRYSSSDGLYIYNLNTSGLAKGAYRLLVDLHDGSAPRAIDIALK